MKKYYVTGMSCAACKARVEKSVSCVSGVTSCNVNLINNTMQVDGSFEEKDVIQAVKNAGYGIKTSPKEETNDETKKLKTRLFSSLVFLLVLMYISMGTMLFDLPLPKFLSENHFFKGLAELVLSLVVLIINNKFFISGFKSLFKKSPNMDTLVAIGSGVAFVYSIYALFKGDMHGLYFESSAMILTLITLGKMLEARSKGKTTSAVKSLMALAPKTATVIRDGKECVVELNELNAGDIFIVRAGENFPADGVVLDGLSTVNESMITGESVPVDKSVGDEVISSTTNLSGYLVCKATKTGEDTTLSQIIKMVEDAAGAKAPIAKLADKVSGVFVPIVIIIAVLTFIIWTILGESVSFSLARAISVLVISCPCALGLATPVAIMVGSGVGARNGILFKTAESIENTGKAKIIVLDKTGTITKGMPEVTDIFCAEETREKLLRYSFSLERKSEHPLARAVVSFAEEKNIPFLESDSFKTLPGNGVEGIIEGKLVYGGNIDFIKTKSNVSEDIINKAKEFSLSGKTPLFFATEDTFLGIIAVADTIKEDSKDAIEKLKKMGLRVCMLTGDNEHTALSISKMAGIDEVRAKVLPEGKGKEIEKLKKQGLVIMVGDGINDAPALKMADIGMAIGSGTDIAIESADVVLVKNSLTDIVNAVRLSRKTLKIIKENLFWAFFYNTLGIPLAAGLFGWELNPMFAAAAMSLSSFCVVSNALRINRIKFGKKEGKTVKKTFKIEGMMCPHCEGRVKKALENTGGVKMAEVSYEKGEAVVTLDENIDEGLLKSVIENDGYKVLAIE